MCGDVQKHAEELAVLESLDNGKPFHIARTVDVPLVRNLREGSSSRPSPYTAEVLTTHDAEHRAPALLRWLGGQDLWADDPYGQQDDCVHAQGAPRCCLELLLFGQECVVKGKPDLGAVWIAGVVGQIIPW